LFNIIVLNKPSLREYALMLLLLLLLLLLLFWMASNAVLSKLLQL
jgi:hypothetical protein